MALVVHTLPSTGPPLTKFSNNRKSHFQVFPHLKKQKQKLSQHNDFKSDFYLELVRCLYQNPLYSAKEELPQYLNRFCPICIV